MGDRRRRTTTYTTSTTSYGASNNRSTFGYWVPLVLTVTAATVGLAAWIWSERSDDEDTVGSDHEHYQGGVPPPGYATMSGGLPPGPGPAGFQPPPGPMPPQGPAGGFQGPPGPSNMGFQGTPPPGGYGEQRSVSTEAQQQNTGFMARMTNVLGMGGQNAPPQQGGNWAAKGMAAAGAVVGGAISSLREGGSEEQFSDQEKWSEEADKPGRTSPKKKGLKRQGTADEFYSGAVEIPRQSSVARKRRTVAIVVSAVATGDGDTEVGGHASILSHLPEFVNPTTTRIFVLIYTPDLRTHPLSATARRSTRRPSQSMSSSFSNISQADAQHTPVQTPGEFPQQEGDDQGILAHVDPNPIDESSSLYKTLHNQAMALVDRDNMILPFTSPQGHKHILKSIQPELVYMQESLCGTDGETVSELQGWVRQIVVVIGDEGGAGGLVDTDDEAERRDSSKTEPWWRKEERTGVGRGCSVVESIKIGEDWNRRVNDRD